MQYSPALNKVGCCLCKPGTKKSASVMTYEGICYPKRWTDPWKDDASLNDAETEILLPLASDDFDSDYDESFPEHLSKYYNILLHVNEYECYCKPLFLSLLSSFHSS